MTTQALKILAGLNLRPRLIWTLVAAVLGIWLFASNAVCCVASSVHIEFESVSDLTLFSRRNAFQFSPIPWSGSGGVGNSGSLAIIAHHQTVYSASSVSFKNIGSKIVLSAFFRTADVGPIDPGRSYHYADLYLTRSPAGYRFVDHTAFVYVDAISDRERIIGGPLQAGGGSFPGFSEEFPRGTITPGHWHELKVEYERLAGNRIGWQIDVNDYGVDGLGYLKTAYSTSQETPDGLGITTDATLYAGFEASVDSTLAIDKFSMFEIPEPHSTMLVTTSFLCLLRRKFPTEGRTRPSLIRQHLWTRRQVSGWPKAN